eukprot:scaffold12327_cov54-Phaeocystis_antarctica.AAC.3
MLVPRATRLRHLCEAHRAVRRRVQRDGDAAVDAVVEQIGRRRAEEMAKLTAAARRVVLVHHDNLVVVCAPRPSHKLRQSLALLTQPGLRVEQQQQPPLLWLCLVAVAAAATATSSAAAASRQVQRMVV